MGLLDKLSTDYKFTEGRIILDKDLLRDGGEAGRRADISDRLKVPAV